MRGDVIEKARELLRERALCDRCLGRFFAGLGYGWSNVDRGAALKKVIVMDYHDRIKKGDDSALKEFLDVAANIGYHASSLYKMLTGNELEARECSLCDNKLDQFLSEAVERGYKLLALYGVSKFIVGAKVPREVLELEEKIALSHGLREWESIRREIKREIGKGIEARYGLKPDFKEPEAMLVINYPSLEMDIIVSSLIIRGRYWKTGRMISQAYWPTLGGVKYYSIEQALYSILKVLRAESIVLHASGREDVDARMLGSGRPALVEVKTPRVRSPDLRTLEDIIAKSSQGLVMFKFEGFTVRDLIRVYKEELAVKGKIYRALIAIEGGVKPGDISLLEESFKNTTIAQRTPTRVLHRKKDIERIKKVYDVKCRPIGGPLIECLVKTPGGLYVKELINGDGGRTKPSFSEILGRRAECFELDVLYVGEHPFQYPNAS